MRELGYGGNPRSRKPLTKYQAAANKDLGSSPDVDNPPNKLFGTAEKGKE